MVHCKWVYKTKYTTNEFVDKYKTSLVGKRFSQVESIDYYKTFSSIAKMDSICMVLSLATSQGLSTNTSFMHGDLHDEIYME